LRHYQVLIKQGTLGWRVPLSESPGKPKIARHGGGHPGNLLTLGHLLDPSPHRFEGDFNVPPTLLRRCPAYWITSSARRSSDGGIVIPSACAVFRLMTSSNFVDCSALYAGYR
jgi:hypothetical protein